MRTCVFHKIYLYLDVLYDYNRRKDVKREKRIPRARLKTRDRGPKMAVDFGPGFKCFFRLVSGAPPPPPKKKPY